MTGIRFNGEKESQLPLRHENAFIDPVAAGRQMNHTLLQFAAAIFLILIVTAYLILADKPNHVALEKQSEAEKAPIRGETKEYAERFVDFMKKFNKEYKERSELLKRFKTYEKHMIEVEELNRNNAHSASYGESDLSDWTDEEFRKKLREEAKFIRRDPPKLERSMPIPPSFDWRTKNVISPVKAQGKCGSCWAFAATATVEAAWAIAHKEMRNLSEQTLLDCDLADNACDGGDEDKAFRCELERFATK